MPTAATLRRFHTTLANYEPALGEFIADLVFRKTSKGTQYYESQDQSTVVIHRATTTVSDLAFMSNKNLVSVVIPSSVTSIGYHAFCSCPGLASVVIPRSVTSIGYLAFSWCTALSSVRIPDSVATIGDGAFMGCSRLASVSVPSRTALGRDAFPCWTTVVRRPAVAMATAERGQTNIK
jgi:hypothetical protein